MTKCESFNWEKNGKVCNGIYDFGLLRDKPSHEEKPKLFSVYFSRTVFVVGVLAGFTFLICLILADKYQKSAKVSHHYASYIYEKEHEKLLPDNKKFNGAKKTVEEAFLNSVGLKKIQNIYKNIPIDEINRLIPVTTVLHSVNESARNARTFAEMRMARPNLYQLNKNVGETSLKNTMSKKPLNLAELLKRTETKSVKKDAQAEFKSTTAKSTITTEVAGMQFAQLESYKHFGNSKNLQELLEYIDCNSATNCGRKFTTQKPTEESQIAEVGFENESNNIEDDQNVRILSDQLSSTSGLSLPNNSNNDDMLYSDTNAPLLYSPYFSQQHRFNILDPFYNFRASSPLEINDLDESESAEQPEHSSRRFSNRIYRSHESRIYMPALEPYLKPPTPPPTGLSFTPSYTTAIFHDLENARQQEELKSEATSLEPVAQVKPISLMVEIFPATNYELPTSFFPDKQQQQHQQQFPKQQDQLLNDPTPTANGPPWLPWKLSPYSQNRMRLFVNLFPQHFRTSN